MVSRNGFSKHRRKLQIEKLESRSLLIAEGSPVQWSESLDISGLSGALSGTVDWGDGSVSPLSFGTPPVTGPIKFRFDYSQDSTGFFNAPARRALLQQSADTLSSKWSDTLTAIVPTGTSQWTAMYRHPATGQLTSKQNLSIAANEILVFVGARDLGGDGERASAYRGGFSLSTTNPSFSDAVRTRGQSGAVATPATDFGPWGGSITFDLNTTWFFGTTTTGLGSDTFDFTSVAQHELIHILGFSSSASFDAKITSNGFVGAHTSAIAGQSTVPLDASHHFSSDLMSNNQQTLMSASIQTGQRKLITRLDLAALQDVGWQLITPAVESSSAKTYGDNGSFTQRVVVQGSIYGKKEYLFTESVINVPPTFANPIPRTATAGIELSISQMGQFSDPGYGSPLATPPQQESFTYTINWGDQSPSDKGTARIDSLGSSGLPTKGSFDGKHTYLATGMYTVSMTVQDDDGGSQTKLFTVNVVPPPQLIIALDRTSIFENQGQNAAMLSIRRLGFDIKSPLSINLTSSDTSEASIASAATFDSGVDFISVPVHAVDDTILDGSINVTLRAAAGSVQSNLVSLVVLDRESLALNVNRNTFGENEGAGAAILTVKRLNTDIDQPLTLQLSSSDISELNIPLTVTIPAGSSSILVGVSAVDDSIFDGPQSVRVTASESRYQGASLDFTVTDYQPLQLALQKNTLTEEDPSNNSTTLRISIRSNAPASGVAVKLSTDIANRLQMPSQVLIPAGNSFVDIAVTAIDDFIPQGLQMVRILAAGNNLVSSTAPISIADSDPAYWTNPDNPLDVNNQSGVDPLDVLAVVNELNRSGSRPLDPRKDLSLPFVDTNRDGYLDPLDVLGIVNYINERR